MQLLYTLPSFCDAWPALDPILPFISFIRCSDSIICHSLCHEEKSLGLGCTTPSREWKIRNKSLPCIQISSSFFAVVVHLTSSYAKWSGKKAKMNGSKYKNGNKEKLVQNATILFYSSVLQVAFRVCWFDLLMSMHDATPANPVYCLFQMWKRMCKEINKLFVLEKKRVNLLHVFILNAKCKIKTNMRNMDDDDDEEEDDDWRTVYEELGGYEKSVSTLFCH